MNENEVKNKKNSSLVIVIVLLIMVIIGLCIFIVCNIDLSKDKKEDETNNILEENTNKEIDINSDLVQNLVYPISNSKTYGSTPNKSISNATYAQTTYSNFVLKEEYASSYDFGNKIVASLDNYDVETVDCYYYGNNFSLSAGTIQNMGACKKVSEEIINNGIKKVFGPDSNYNLQSSQSLRETYCGYPKFYDSETKAYYGPQGCGGAGFMTFKPILKTYKAELNGDYLYIYDYALINYLESSPDIGTVSLLFDSYEAYKNYENSKSVDASIGEVKSETEAKLKLDELINSNKASTYIWTFKKQSDGNYYYFSSKWENK